MTDLSDTPTEVLREAATVVAGRLYDINTRNMKPEQRATQMVMWAAINAELQRRQKDETQ